MIDPVFRGLNPIGAGLNEGGGDPGCTCQCEPICNCLIETATIVTYWSGPIIDSQGWRWTSRYIPTEG